MTKKKKKRSLEFDFFFIICRFDIVCLFVVIITLCAFKNNCKKISLMISVQIKMRTAQRSNEES